jgi:hypothetical protein
MISMLQLLPAPARRPLVLAVLLIGGMSLAGCAAATIGDHLPSAAGGLPQNAPPRPSTSGDYPAVHDMPPPRSTTPLSEEEQQKLEDDLIAARKRVGGKGKPAGTTRNK